ncbi:MAG TPA: methyltransferase domain-containing protein [Gemmatimonadaceae bacterium]|nr:methyltransferase domain-containing protein [Gemmatimonadaceae bacterium]
MPNHQRNYRAILERNVGFDGNTRWLRYARRNGFKEVKAERVRRCPDCGGRPKRKPWGQYVHFSTLIHLLECSRCGLVWSDARIDPGLVRRQFEVMYNGEKYFRFSRRRIFRHLARVIDDLAPRGAHVLDIGGARGDLMAHLVERRPDLYVVVNDISASGTKAANEQHGFPTITGGAQALDEHERRYDIVVLSDVLYFEPDIRRLWSALDKLVAPGGTVILRLPHKWPLIRLWQRWYRATRSRARQRLQHRIRFFNPEHIFIFRRQYLRARLAAMGFGRIRAMPSPVLAHAGTRAFDAAAYAFATLLYWLTAGALAVTPSIVVVGAARRA